MTTATKDVLSPEQIRNLLILSDYLKSGDLKATFDIGRFSIYEWPLNKIATECGTVGCAVGQGPYAEIPKNKGEGWLDYANRCFTNNIDRIWNFLFSGDWQHVDNTPEGAAARIDYFLENGAPPPEEIDGMQDGDIPLIYKTQNDEAEDKA